MYQFEKIYNRVLPLNSFKNFVSAHYCENERMEFDKICNKYVHIDEL